MIFNDDMDGPIWALLHSLPSAVAYWDRDLTCRFANRAHADWFNLRPSEMVDLHFSQLLGKQRAAQLQPVIDLVLAGETQEYEVSLPRPGAASRPALIRYTPHRTRGKVVGFIAEATDVSSLQKARNELSAALALHRHTEAQLKKSQAALHQAQQLAGVGSWEWEIDTDTVQWSAHLYLIFGLDPNLPPPSFAEHDLLYTPSSMLRLKAAATSCSSSGTPYCIELEYLHRSGRRGWLEARGQAIRDSRGRVVGLHGTAQEISSRLMARRVPEQAQRIADLEAQLAAEMKVRRQLQAELQLLRSDLHSNIPPRPPTAAQADS